MDIQEYQEYQLSPTTAASIQELLQDCFPGYPADRNYFKSTPTFRLLAWEDGILIGQVAVVFRVIKIGQTLARIFGISDVCVHPNHRSKNTASILLEQLKENCSMYNIDFLILIAEEQSLYKKCGYTAVSNTVRWSLINDHQSLGMMDGKLDKSLMMMKTGKLKWNKGLVDLMGGLF